MGEANPVTIPADSHQNLTMFEPRQDHEEQLNVPYREAVGCLQFLSLMTRPDINFAVNAVSKYSVNSTKVHWNTVKRILKYLNGTMDYGIKLRGRHNQLGREAFSDADFAEGMKSRLYIRIPDRISWFTSLLRSKQTLRCLSVD
uniref:Reverse transcriptase Ty1/copia-type domain-containing protein n=1 Tax=Bracon brevicornis TaxID=1563983 RepID=A0A6V7JQC5_9HYME